MAMKKHASDVIAVSRDAKTGRLLPAGYGALKGKYAVRKGVDVTKPIFEQVGLRTRREVARKGSARAERLGWLSLTLFLAEVMIKPLFTRFGSG